MLFRRPSLIAEIVASLPRSIQATFSSLLRPQLVHFATFIRFELRHPKHSQRLIVSISCLFMIPLQWTPQPYTYSCKAIFGWLGSHNDTPAPIAGSNIQRKILPAYRTDPAMRINDRLRINPHPAQPPFHVRIRSLRTSWAHSHGSYNRH